MNLKLVKATAITVIASMCFSASIVSFAEEDFNPVIADINFEKNHGKPGAVSYTLEELANSVGVDIRPLTPGDNMIFEQASKNVWRQPVLKTDVLPASERTSGFNIVLDEPVKTGRLSVMYSMSGIQGMGGRRVPIIFNGFIPIFSDLYGWGIHRSEKPSDLYTEGIGLFHDKEIIFQRSSEAENWTVKARFKEGYDWQTFTVPKSYLPEITSVGAGATLKPDDENSSLKLRFTRYKVTYYPDPSLEKASDVGVDEELIIKSKLQFDKNTVNNGTVILKKLQGKAAIGDPISVTCTLADGGKTVNLKPAAALEPGTDYQVTLSGVKDVDGNEYSNRMNFKTAGTKAAEEKGLPFEDLGSHGWATEAIKTLYDKKIVSGRDEKTFDPAGVVTRAEFIKMLVGTFNYSQVNTKDIVFADVADSDWYGPYVKQAAANGVVTGDQSGNFNPSNSITRQDMAVMVCRACKLENSAKALDFTDAADISTYAYDAVAALYEKGFVSGVGDGTFAPKKTVTRAEAAQILYNVLKAVA